MWFDTFSTPIGLLSVAADASGVRHVLFEDNKYAVAGREHWQRDRAVVADAREQLLAYFAGHRKIFDLPLNPLGTPFQVKVWHALAEIPFGSTCSYGDLARRIGKAAAVRAVGAANGRNPLPIVLPCHRVIGSDGSLTGFGGGLPLKQFLLEHEGARQGSLRFQTAC